MLPPILPASLEDKSPLYPCFKLTPTSEATSYLNLFRASLASGTTFGCYYCCLPFVFSPPIGLILFLESKKHDCFFNIYHV